MSKRTRLFLLISLYLIGLPVAWAEVGLSVQVVGIEGSLQKNIEARLDSVQKTSGVLTEKKIQRLYIRAPQEIRKALEPYGYFRPQISSRLTRQAQDHWIATYRVLLGPALRIRKIDLRITGEGRNLPALQEYRATFPLRVGQTLETPTYEAAKEKLFAIANENGYVRANLTNSKILVNVDEYRADIVMHFDTGPRYYFGPIIFEHSAYSEAFLHRFVDIKENEVFSSQKLINLQQQLAGSFYFQQVLVTPDFEAVSDYHVPVHIRLTPPKSQRYTVGVGYGSFTGPRLIAGMSLRRVTETGQHFDAQLRLSTVLSQIAAKYYIPGRNPLTDQWSLGGNYQRFNPENGESISGTLSAGYTKQHNNWQWGTSLNYLRERYAVNNTNTRLSELLYPNANFTFIKADDRINPHFGASVNFMLQGASQGILSTTSFMQGLLKTKYVLSPTNLLKLIFRADMGYTLVHELKELPLSMRFFAGGITSVRGYPDSYIGPGRYLTLGSAELQHTIYGNWAGAIFYDLGNATNKWNKHYRNGKGIGVIYNSMIGPVKLYVAKGKKYGVELSIGPEF